jgi:hypothetical protein
MRMSSSKTKLKTWIAYRIKGARSEKHDGVICAETQQAALMEAYKVFNATAEYQRRRVYVREVQEWGTNT